MKSNIRKDDGEYRKFNLEADKRVKSNISYNELEDQISI